MIDSRTCDSAPVTVPLRGENDRHRIEKLLVGEIDRKPISKVKNSGGARVTCIAGNVYSAPHKASTYTKFGGVSELCRDIRDIPTPC